MPAGAGLYGPGVDVYQGTPGWWADQFNALVRVVEGFQSGGLTDGAVTDAKVAANAAIAQSKIAGLVAALAAKAPSTGIPQSAVVNLASDLASKATPAQVTAAVNALVASAPGALDTLNELATALGNDPNFATTITNALAAKQPLIPAGTYAKAVEVDDFLPASPTASQTLTAIQAALTAAGRRPTRFTPGRTYSIPSAIAVGTGAHVVAHGATIRNVSGTGDNLIKNADPTGGNPDIIIEGGTWDYDSATNPSATTEIKLHGMVLRNCDRLILRDIELRNALKWAILVADSDDIDVRDIDFDTDSDGLHLHGPMARPRIRNLRGITGDDMLAFLTNDYPGYATSTGDFSDIEVDGVYPRGSVTAVALAGDPGHSFKGTTTIRNIKGTVSTVGIRVVDDPVVLTKTVVDSLMIEGIDVDNGNVASPIVNLAATWVGSCTVNGIVHANTSLAVLVDTPASVGTLKVLDYVWRPRTGSPSEVQTIGLGAATAGTVTIDYEGFVTSAIARNASLATIQAAMDALPNVSPGDIVASGGPFPGVVTFTFAERLAGRNQPKFIVTPTGLTGGTVTVTVTTQGGGVIQPLVNVLGSCNQLMFDGVAATLAPGSPGGKIFQNNGVLPRVSMANIFSSGKGSSAFLQTGSASRMAVYIANSEFHDVDYAHQVGGPCTIHLANVGFERIVYLFNCYTATAALRVLAGVVRTKDVTLPIALAGGATISANGEMLLMDATGGNQINAAVAGDRVFDRITNKPVLYNGAAWVAAY